MPMLRTAFFLSASSDPPCDGATEVLAALRADPRYGGVRRRLRFRKKTQKTSSVSLPRALYEGHGLEFTNGQISLSCELFKKKIVLYYLYDFFSLRPTAYIRLNSY